MSFPRDWPNTPKKRLFGNWKCGFPARNRFLRGTKAFDGGTKAFREGTKSFRRATKAFTGQTKSFSTCTKSFTEGKKSFTTPNKSFTGRKSHFAFSVFGAFLWVFEFGTSMLRLETTNLH